MNAAVKHQRINIRIEAIKEIAADAFLLVLVESKAIKPNLVPLIE
jgi:hypothetical protein